MLNSRNCKRLLTNGWKILKEGRDKVFSLKGANSVYKSHLLVMFPLLKAAYIEGLDQVGLVRGVFYHLDLIHLSCNNELVGFVAYSTIN
jgi:hypothetical protein